MGQQVSFDFSIGDQVRLKDATHIGGRVSGLCFRSGAQVIEVHHYTSEGEMGVREFPSADLEASPPVSVTDNKPKATPGAPPSAVVIPATTAAPSAAGAAGAAGSKAAS